MHCTLIEFSLDPVLDRVHTKVWRNTSMITVDQSIKCDLHSK
jgi:hypothetical protein